MGEKMKWLDNYVPPGMDGYREFKIYIGAVIFATLESFLYFVLGYSNAYSNLFDYRFGKRVLIENVFIGPYDHIVEGVFWVPLLICIAIFFVTIYHYMYHYQGSKMMYLMKRLPDKWEVHRRCWTLPVVGSVLMAVWILVLRMLYFAIYIVFTPSQCLPLPM